MSVYLVDRNVVIDIESEISRRPNSHKLDLIALDKRKNFISCILSAVEAHIGAARNASAIEASIHRETAIIDSFFKLAKTDGNFLRDDSTHLANEFANEIARTFDDDMSYVGALQRYLAKQSSKAETNHSFFNLSDYIASRGRQIADPISLIAIGSVLGCTHARDLLKPTAQPEINRTFNALADVEKIKMTNYIRHISQSSGRATRIKLYSFDKALVKMSNLIRVKESLSYRREEKGFESVTYAIDEMHFLSNMPFLIGSGKLMGRVRQRLLGVTSQ